METESAQERNSEDAIYRKDELGEEEATYRNNDMKDMMLHLLFI